MLRHCCCSFSFLFFKWSIALLQVCSLYAKKFYNRNFCILHFKLKHPKFLCFFSTARRHRRLLQAGSLLHQPRPLPLDQPRQFHVREEGRGRSGQWGRLASAHSSHAARVSRREPPGEATGDFDRAGGTGERIPEEGRVPAAGANAPAARGCGQAVGRTGEPAKIYRQLFHADIRHQAATRSTSNKMTWFPSTRSGMELDETCTRHYRGPFVMVCGHLLWSGQ